MIHVCLCIRNLLAVNQFCKQYQLNLFRNKYIIDKSKIPTINEKDLEETFIRGSGPGGQSVNKSSNACSIKHIPTGLVVKCHEHRSLESNRKKARESLVNKLDIIVNGDESIESQKKRQMKQKSLKAEQKRKKKEMMKKVWKENQEFS